MIMKTRLIVIAALCGALLCSCGNRNKKAQKESVYKETIELTTVEGDHTDKNCGFAGKRPESRCGHQ